MSAVITSNPPFAAEADPVAVFPGRYELSDLGELPGGEPLLPVAINDRGEVAVYGHPPEKQAKHWNVRGLIRRGARLVEHAFALGGVPLTSLSNNGLLAGQERVTGGPLRAWAMHLGNIGATHWPDAESCAVGVNSQGLVAGHVAFEAEGRVRRRVFLVNARNEAAFLPAPNGASAVAVGLNEAGAVLLNSTKGFFEIASQAMVWSNGVMTAIEGVAGGGSWGAALSQAGRVAGRLLTPNGSIRAFLHEDGRTYDLSGAPDAQSEALGVNDQRVVVGRMLGPDGGRHAFRWTPADGMRRLADLVPDAPGWALHKAIAVNAGGQIVGTGIFNHTLRGFVLSPAG